MTQPLPAGLTKFGPGIFTIGATGDLITASCLVNKLTLAPSVSKAAATTKLCGTVRPGAVTTTWKLEGNVDADAANPTGFWAKCFTARGSAVPFSYTPSAGGPTAAGTIQLDPLALGGDEYGADMTSDFSFELVGDPSLTWPPATSSSETS